MYTCITPLPYGERTANSARQPRGRDGRDALLLRAKVTACVIASFSLFLLPNDGKGEKVGTTRGRLMKGWCRAWRYAVPAVTYGAANTSKELNVRWCVCVWWGGYSSLTSN